MSVEKMEKFLLSFEEKDTKPQFVKYIVDYKTQTTGASIIQILNTLVSFIDEDKCYVEVGTHKGSTLIGASLNNKAKCWGVDNFAGHNSAKEVFPFKTIKENLDNNLKKWSSKHNASYFEKDFLEFLVKRTNVEGQKVEVYFYDGDHQEEPTYLGLKHCVDMLSDEAIVVLDDSANNDRPAVLNAVNRILKEDKRFSFIREWIPIKMHGHMWCGFLALKFKK